jgi:hypothetical protein
MHIKYAAHERIGLAVTALGVGVAAILTGIYIAIVIVAPMFPNSGSGIATASELSERFEPRTVDLTKASPNPSPYRTPTPEFNKPEIPNYAALAKQKARTRLADGQSNSDGLPVQQDADDWFGFQSGMSRPRTTYRPPDRHTGTMF